MFRICLLVLLAWVEGAPAACRPDVINSMQFAVEYAVWRGWRQVLVFDEFLETECRPASVVRLCKCLSVNDVASTTAAATGANGPELARSIRVGSHLGLLLFAPNLHEPYPNKTEIFLAVIKKLFDLNTNTEPYDWLIITTSPEDLKYVNSILKTTPLRFDQHIAAAYPTYTNTRLLRDNVLCNGNFLQEKQESFHKNHIGRSYYPRIPECSRYGRRTSMNCSRIYSRRFDTNYFKTSIRYSNLTKNMHYIYHTKSIPLRFSGLLEYNYSTSFVMQNVSKFSLKKYRHVSRRRMDEFRSNNFEMQLVQYFKVRLNSTLYSHLLGIWSGNESMSRVAPPYPVEARSFLGEELLVGRCNGSMGAEGSDVEEQPVGGGGADEEATTDSVLMDDMIHFLTLRINATPAVRYFNKLGFRSYEGAWSGLLGALVESSVDIAMEPVTAHSARHRDMDFIFPIAQTMRNIYIRQQETSTVRDIFLAPFSPRLIMCVVAMTLALSVAMVVVSRLLWPVTAAPTVTDSNRSMGCVEAMIWTTGIMCQQGGAWMPRSTAARILLVSCLLFGLVIYNSYAAFITSVLSVRVASLDTVAAVLHSPHFKIGYIQNGADQMYLMSTKDEDLNKFYIRGYSNSKNLVSTAEEGLARAAQQDYAFFASQRVARGTLRALSQARGRCSVKELPVPSTLAHVAFPLSRRSPYAKPTLLSLVSLRGGGVLARLGAALVPSMPQCAPPPGFASARPADVRSALLLLALGGAASAVLGIGEYCWMNRQRLKRFLKTRCEELLHLVH